MWYRKRVNEIIVFVIFLTFAILLAGFISFCVCARVLSFVFSFTFSTRFLIVIAISISDSTCITPISNASTASKHSSPSITPIKSSPSFTKTAYLTAYSSLSLETFSESTSADAYSIPTDSDDLNVTVTNQSGNTFYESCVRTPRRLKKFTQTVPHRIRRRILDTYPRLQRLSIARVFQINIRGDQTTAQSNESEATGEEDCSCGGEDGLFDGKCLKSFMEMSVQPAEYRNSQIMSSTPIITKDVYDPSLFNVARFKKVELHELSPKMSEFHGKLSVLLLLLWLLFETTESKKIKRNIFVCPLLELISHSHLINSKLNINQMRIFEWLKKQHIIHTEFPPFYLTVIEAMPKDRCINNNNLRTPNGNHNGNQANMFVPNAAAVIPTIATIPAKGQQQPQQQQHNQHQSSTTTFAAAPEDGSVLKKVISFTLDQMKNAESKSTTRPSFVPEKLHFSAYEQFKGKSAHSHTLCVKHHGHFALLHIPYHYIVIWITLVVINDCSLFRRWMEGMLYSEKKEQKKAADMLLSCFQFIIFSPLENLKRMKQKLT